MSVTLTIKGGPGVAGDLSGIKKLEGATEQQAVDILAQLKGDFGSKTGVVRLMHTSKADRGMKFSDAGGFKQMFIKGAKLERTGTVIAQLMENSGRFTEDEINAFKQYAGRRNTAGIESRRLAEFLAPLKQSTFSTTEAALKSLGVTGHDASGQLGKGAQGTVKKVMVNGQPYALKVLEKVESLYPGEFINPGELKLAGADGKPIDAASRADARRSFEVLSEDSTAGKKSPLNGAKDSSNSNYDNALRVHNSYMSPDDSSSETSYDGRDSDQWMKGQFNQFLQQQLGAGFGQVAKDFGQVANDKSSDSSDLESDDESAHIQLKTGAGTNPDPLPSGQNGRIVSEVSVPANDSPKVGSHVDSVQQPDAGEKTGKSEIKLARTMGIGSVARMKDLTQVVQPSHYFITEYNPNLKEPRVHVVEGGRALKDWAKSQDTGSAFEVTQYLMPLAAGKQLMEFGNSVEKNFKREDLPAVARSMTGLLEQMWRHGFVDGDLKPENLMWDASTKTLRAIDIDSFQKASKKAGSALPGRGVLTIAYAHPQAISNVKPPTLGRDLFSAGMVMLEAALRAKGHDGEADSITLCDGQPMGKAKYIGAGRGPALLGKENAKGEYEGGTLDNMKARLKFADGGVEDFAILCIKTSLTYENEREGKGITSFERYSDAAGPDHPLNILKRHPLMNPAE
jgi:serine/threonine protein kinase